MILQKLSCPFGCQGAVLSESTKTITNPNQNLLLDSEGQFGATTTTVKVYTCTCCNHTFEMASPSQNLNGKSVL